jgi:erythromycin esterase
MTGRLLCAFFLLIAELRGQFARPIRPVGPRLPQPVSGFNFDFSETFQGQPLLWSYYNGASNEYQQLVDTSATYGGAPSLRISAVTAPSSDLGYAELSVPPSVFRGQTITFSGAIKTSGVSGFASLALQVEGPRDAQVLVNLQPNAPTGNTGWQTFSVTAPLVADATGVLIVVTLHGAGSAWFAGLAVEAGGVPLALPATVPDPAQLAWLKVSAFPFTSLDAGMDDAELAPLQTLVGNARIVGLGEGTHGTSEFFRMKSRIISYLARNMGFTVFAIEANLPEAYQMNDYVLNGNGDPKTLLAGMYFWTWNTQEVLDMIQWMRSFNASGQGRIEFLGFDMQYSAVAMNNVATFLAQADPGLMGFLNSNYTVVAQVAELSSPTPAQVTPGMLAAQSVLQILTQNRATYIAKQPAATVDFAIENANIVVQALTLEFNGSSGQYRDAQMAANVEWLASQHPNERIVLWAHDAHINKVDGAMGGALGQDFGSDYLALGMLFHSGSYNAIGGGRLGPNQAAPTVPGSVEYFFHQSGVPQQILDVRLATSESRDASSTWLTGPLWLRTIGAVALPGFYLTPPYAQAFDGIVFFDQTTPSTLLPFPVVISTTLAPAKVSALYFQNLISTYATASVTWQITSGVLPQGLSLAGDGVLSGTPQSAGTYSFQVTPSYYGTPISSATVQLTVGQ